MPTGFNLGQIYYVSKYISKSPDKTAIWAAYWSEANKSKKEYDMAVVLAMGAIIFHTTPQLFNKQFQSVPQNIKELAENMYIHANIEHYDTIHRTVEVSDIVSPDAYTNIFFTEKTRKETKEYREKKALTYIGPKFIRPKRLPVKTAFAHVK